MRITKLGLKCTVPLNPYWWDWWRKGMPKPYRNWRKRTEYAKSANIPIFPSKNEIWTKINCVD